MLQQISDSELEIMKVIWEKGNTALYAVIMEALTERGFTWQKNTVITLLSRLIEKGWIKIKKIGRKNEYTAIISESDYQSIQTSQLIKQVYEGKTGGLVLNLIENHLLSREDLEQLKELWERGTDK